MDQTSLLIILFWVYVIFNEYRIVKFKKSAFKKSGDVARKVVEDFINKDEVKIPGKEL